MYHSDVLDMSHSSLQCIGVEKNLFCVKSGEMHQAENGGGARPRVFALDVHCRQG